MPALSAPQLALIRGQSNKGKRYLHPLVPSTVFAARINSGSITVGANVIPYDSVTVGAYTDIYGDMTLHVGSTPGARDIAVIRVRSATNAHLVVAQNSDVWWADNYYLTVLNQHLCWSKRPYFTGGVFYKDYDIAFSGQTGTSAWEPVAMMGDPAIQLSEISLTVAFDSSASYAVALGASISSRLWHFGDGSTSTATSPSHTYAAEGDYIVSLTVTDSNGKTHTTRRPVSIISRSNCYVDFECTSLEGSIDGGWEASFRVFGNASESDFPERAPIFFFSEDTFGSTAGSVGFPVNRENVLLFGYIDEDSVVKNPQSSEVTFTVKTIHGVMSRTGPFPTYIGDATTPSTWEEGANLTVFRSLVFLLKYHSTVFEIADVNLYFGDTTPIKQSDFPEDSLWGQFTQFLQGRRMMRAGVMRTGTIVVHRDPNLIAVASRGSIASVCQFQHSDWVEEVTLPITDYPKTSTLCLSGLTYDGNPAHEFNPVFGMSPGHPPKEYGSPKEVQSLALLDQAEANSLAGLIVGQDNNAWGEIVLPLDTNWVACFEPARSEYVQTPSSGWVTKRGTVLQGEYLIVRKVSVSFEWKTGGVRCNLTCEAVTLPEPSENGDCYSPAAPTDPTNGGTLPGGPPILPPSPPNPTGGGTVVDIWTLFDSGAIYRLSLLASGGGAATSKPAWAGGGGLSYFAEGHKITTLNKQVLIADDGSEVFTGYSSNEAVSWATTDMGIEGIGSNCDTDLSDRTIVWACSFAPRNPFFTNVHKNALALQIGGTGPYSYTSVINGWTSWYTPWGPLVVYRSNNGGATWTAILIAYLGNLFPTRMSLTGFPAVNAVVLNSNETVYPTTADQEIATCPAYDLSNIVQYADGGGAFQLLAYQICTTIPLQDYNNLTFYPPTVGIFLVFSAHDGATAYALVNASYYDDHFTTAVDVQIPPTANAPVSPFQIVSNGNTNVATIIVNNLYRILADGSFTGVQILTTVYSSTRATLDFGASDPTNSERIYLADTDADLVTYTWGSGPSAQVLPIGNTPHITGIFVTKAGTVLVAINCTGNNTRHILRSTNNGGTWTDIAVTSLVAFFANFLPAEYGSGKVVSPLNHTGTYLYSLNDGASWFVTGDIASHASPQASSARA